MSKNSSVLLPTRYKKITDKMLLEKPTGLNNAQKDCSVSAKHRIQLFRCLTCSRQKCCSLWNHSRRQWAYYSRTNT